MLRHSYSLEISVLLQIFTTSKLHTIEYFLSSDNKKLYIFDRLQRNQPTGLCFHLFAMIQTCAYLYSSNFTPQVKKARNQSQIFNRKSISRNTTHRQSYHLIQIESQNFGLHLFE